MIIYKKEWLKNKYIVDLLKTDYTTGRITKEEFTKIKTAHPVGFYMPGLMVRVGLFILTLIIAIVATSLLSLMAFISVPMGSPSWPIFLGIICYALLEFLTKGKHYFHSGVDNALLYFSAGLFGGGFIWIITDAHITTGDNLLGAMVIALLCIYLSLRFADVVTAAVACVAIFACVYFLWAMMDKFGLATMPFVMMIAAACTYFGFNNWGKNAKVHYYADCIATVKLISLLTLYAAGNYFVVNRLNNMLNSLDDSHTAIPFGFIFWIWTIVLPIVYIWFGLKRKNTMLLRTGMVLVAVTVATFRAYYHLLPIEIMLTLAGIIILVGAYTIIRYLKKPRHGFTYAEPEEANTADSLNLEGLAIGQATSHLPLAAQAPVSRFGGGSGGGGGSSGDF
ncbi:MAG: hypothetical protein V4456_02675 [Bacteroidota bacterium]